MTTDSTGKPKNSNSRAHKLWDSAVPAAAAKLAEAAASDPPPCATRAKPVAGAVRVPQRLKDQARAVAKGKPTPTPTPEAKVAHSGSQAATEPSKPGPAKRRTAERLTSLEESLSAEVERRAGLGRLVTKRLETVESTVRALSADTKANPQGFPDIALDDLSERLSAVEAELTAVREYDVEALSARVLEMEDVAGHHQDTMADHRAIMADHKRAVSALAASLVDMQRGMNAFYLVVLVVGLAAFLALLF